MATGKGTGTTISIAGFTAQVLSLTPFAASKESVDVTHLGSATWRDFVPGRLVDWGEFSLEVLFDPSESIPTGGGSLACTITFPDTTVYSFSAIVVGYEPGVPLEDKMTASMRLKISGAVT